MQESLARRSEAGQEGGCQGSGALTRGSKTKGSGEKATSLWGHPTKKSS